MAAKVPFPFCVPSPPFCSSLLPLPFPSPSPSPPLPFQGLKRINLLHVYKVLSIKSPKARAEHQQQPGAIIVTTRLNSFPAPCSTTCAFKKVSQQKNYVRWK